MQGEAGGAAAGDADMLGTTGPIRDGKRQRSHVISRRVASLTAAEAGGTARVGPGWAQSRPPLRRYSSRTVSPRPASPPAPALTVGIEFALNLLSGLRRRGIDGSELLLEAGIPAEALQHPGARIPTFQLATLLRTLIERHDDEVLGMLSRPSKRGSFALQVRAGIGAATLEQAIRRIAHVFRLLHDDLQLELVHEAPGLAGLRLVFSQAEAAANPHLHELVLRVYWRLLAWLVGGQLPVVRFDFAYPRPPYSEGYGPIFPAPWRFDRPHSALWFQAERLQLPVCRDEAALRRFMADVPVQVILPRRDAGTSGRVRSHLQRTQPLWPDLAQTAQALHLSPSALQRRLSAEGTSFQALKDQLRREVAIYRLHTSDVPLGKLAAELGFSDTAAFQRAFKGWTGLPPGSYRRSPGGTGA